MSNRTKKKAGKVGAKAAQVAALRTGRSGLPAKFDPMQAKAAIETLKAAVSFARRMELWDEGKAAAEQLAQWQEWFVAFWNAKVSKRESPGDNQHKKRSVADRGQTYSVEQAENETGIKKQQVSRWRNGLKRPDYAARIFNAAHTKGMADPDKSHHRSDLQTGEAEWYTPALYIEKARRVLGEIDVDPASCDRAQETIRAASFFTEQTDGLVQEWIGKVWLNPPYGGKLIAAFSAKLLAELEAKRCSGAIMLTNSYTDTSWWHALAAPSNAVCFTRGRIKFESPHGDKAAPTNGQSFFYYGDNLDRFAVEFADVGLIMVRP